MVGRDEAHSLSKYDLRIHDRELSVYKTPFLLDCTGLSQSPQNATLTSRYLFSVQAPSLGSQALESELVI